MVISETAIPGLLLADGLSSQHVVDDIVVSNKHLRIYTVVFDEDQADGIAPLVYAEDLSRNGVYWNGVLIGKGKGGSLLSDGDNLRISPRIQYRFSHAARSSQTSAPDLTRQCEMKHFQTDYKVSDRKLGSGAWGQVFMAIKKSRGTQLACKVVDLRKMKLRCPARFGGRETENAKENVTINHQNLSQEQSTAERKREEYRCRQQLRLHYREAGILASLSHPNIISIEKIYITDNTIYIFQDLLTGGDLFSFLERKNGTLSDVEAAVIVRQILIALEYLHDHGIVHRDLKPENVLMTSLACGCRVVLTDFGHAKKLHDPGTRMITMAGTEQYTAPEIICRSKHFKVEKGYTRAIDMWSLGCLTVVLLTGGSPFVNQTTNQYSPNLARECNLRQLETLVEWQLVGQRPKDFVNQLLVLDERERMTAKDAKNHPWFSNEFHSVDFEAVYRRATKHWKPRVLKGPVIEVIEGKTSGELSQLPHNTSGCQGLNHETSLSSDSTANRPCANGVERLEPIKRSSTQSVELSEQPLRAANGNGPCLSVRASSSGVKFDAIAQPVPDIHVSSSDGSKKQQKFRDRPEQNELKELNCSSTSLAKTLSSRMGEKQENLRANSTPDRALPGLEARWPAVARDGRSKSARTDSSNARESHPAGQVEGLPKTGRSSGSSNKPALSERRVMSEHRIADFGRIVAMAGSKSPRSLEKRNSLLNRSVDSQSVDNHPQATEKGRIIALGQPAGLFSCLKTSFDHTNSKRSNVMREVVRNPHELEDTVGFAKVYSPHEIRTGASPQQSPTPRKRTWYEHDAEGEENAKLSRHGGSQWMPPSSQNTTSFDTAAAKSEVARRRQGQTKGNKHSQPRFHDRGKLWNIWDGFAELYLPR